MRKRQPPKSKSVSVLISTSIISTDTLVLADADRLGNSQGLIGIVLVYPFRIAVLQCNSVCTERQVSSGFQNSRESCSVGL